MSDVAVGTVDSHREAVVKMATDGYPRLPHLVVVPTTNDPLAHRIQIGSIIVCQMLRGERWTIYNIHSARCLRLTLGWVAGDIRRDMGLSDAEVAVGIRNSRGGLNPEWRENQE